MRGELIGVGIGEGDLAEALEEGTEEAARGAVGEVLGRVFAGEGFEDVIDGWGNLFAVQPGQNAAEDAP
jgi:hypothetical protein